MSHKAIQFQADKIIVRQMRSDGSYRVEIDTGEYNKNEMAELFQLPQDVVYKITVEPVVDEETDV